MKRMIQNKKNLKSRRFASAAVAGLSAAAVVITSVLSGAIEVEAADTLLGIEKLRSRYMESGSEFVILEVVPERKAAEIGFLVGDYEPLLGEWDEEEQVWKSWRDMLCDLPQTRRKDFIEGKKAELRAYYKKHGLTGAFPVEAVAAEYEEGEPKQDGFEKIVSDGSKRTGWFEKIGDTPEEGTERYQAAFGYNGLYNSSYEFYEDVLYYNVLSATKIDENLAGGIAEDRPIYTKQDKDVYEYCGTWGEINGVVMTALAEEDDREAQEDEKETRPDEDKNGDDETSGGNDESGEGETSGGNDEDGGETGGGNDESGEGETSGGNDENGEGETGGGNDEDGEGETSGGNDESGDGETGGENGESSDDATSGGKDAGGGSENGGNVAAAAVSAPERMQKNQWIKMVADGDPVQDGDAKPADSEEAADTEKPENPEGPTEPGDTGNQELPAQPEKPENPENPTGPESPQEPGDQENPSQPENPKEPGNAENPTDPENPKEPGDTEIPTDPENPENPADPEEPEEDEPAADDPVEKDENKTNAFAQESREYYLVAFKKVDDNTEPAANTPMYSIRSKDDIVLSEDGEYEFIEWDGEDVNQGRQEYTFAGKEIWCRNTFKNNEWFKKYVLNMDNPDYGKFRIKVLTFTPQELGAMERIPNFHFLYLNSGLRVKEAVSDNSTVSGNNGAGGDTENGGEGETALEESVKTRLFAADSLPGKWRKLVADGNMNETIGGSGESSGKEQNGNGAGENSGETPDKGNGTGENNDETPDKGNGAGENNGDSPDNENGAGENNDGAPDKGNGTGENNGDAPDNGGNAGENNGETPDKGNGAGENNDGAPEGGNGAGENNGGASEGGNGAGENNGDSPDNGDDEGENNGGSTDKGEGTEDNNGSGESSVSENNGGAKEDSVSENSSSSSKQTGNVSGSVSDNDIGDTGASAYGPDNDLSGELLKYFFEKAVAGAVPCLIDGSILYAKDLSGSIAVNEKLESTNIFRLSAMLCQDNLSEWYEDHHNNYNAMTTAQLMKGIVEDADKNFVEEHVYCRFGNGTDSIINDRFSEPTIYMEGGEIEPGFQCVLDEIRLENLYRESDTSGNYKPLSTKISQAKAVRHILNYADRRKVKAKEEIKVLEIQPAMADEPELTLDQIKKWAPDVEKAEITVMTTAEFIGKIEKLNETYDLIYIGTSKDHLNMRYWTDSNYIGKPNKDHVAAGTVFNDSDMDGLIYYNIGDKRVVTVHMAGLLDTEYPSGSRGDGWTYFYNYTRYGGNDISKEKMEALISFMDGSYPVIIADDFLEQPVTVFADKEHKGARVNLAEGEYTQARLTGLGVKTADISSVKVKEGYRVTLFDRDNFEFYSLSFDSKDEETYDLSKCKYGNNGNTWDNRTVSLIVEREEDATPARKIDGNHIDNCTYLYEFVEKAMEEKYLNFYAWSDIAENSELFKFYLNRPKVSLEDKAANGEVKEGSNIYYIESDINGRYELQYKFKIQNEGTASYSTRYQCKLYIDVNSDGKFSGSEEIEDIVLTQGGSRVSADDLYADREYMLSRAVPVGYKGLLPWRVEITQADNPNIYTSMSGYTKLLGLEKEVLKICQITRSKGSVINLQQEIEQEGNAFHTLIYGGSYGEESYPGIADEFELDITTINTNEFVKRYEANNNYLKDFNMLILGFSDMYDDFEGDEKSGPMGAIVEFINSGKSVLLGHDTTSFFNSPGTGNEIKGYPWRHLNSLRNQAGSEQRFAATLNRYVRPIVGMDRYGILQTDVLRRGEVLEKGTGDYETVLESGKDVAYKPKSGRKETVPEVHGYTYGVIAAKDQKVEIDKETTTKYQYTRENMLSGNYDKYPKIVFENKYTNIRYDAAYFDDSSVEEDPARYGELEKSANGQVKNVHATQVNQGQITEYPYKLKEDFEVGRTHMQYYQLDYTADDDGDGQSDLVVWYCLGGRTSNDPKKQTTVYSQSPNDVCNNYYIYNKGNITYTGMGHSAGDNPGYTFEEAKLFINTMIASYQAGIRDPQVRVLKSGVPEADEMKLLYRYYDYYDQGNKFSLDDEVTAEGYEKIYFTVQDTNLIKGTRKIASQVFYKDDGGSLEIEADEVTGPNGEKVKQKVRVSPVSGSICSAKDDSVVAFDNLASGGVYYIQVPKDIMQKSEDGLDLYFEAQTTLTTNTAKQNVYKTEKAYAKLQVLQAYLFDLE